MSYSIFKYKWKHIQLLVFYAEDNILSISTILQTVCWKQLVYQVVHTRRRQEVASSGMMSRLWSKWRRSMRKCERRTRRMKSWRFWPTNWIHCLTTTIWEFTEECSFTRLRRGSGHLNGKRLAITRKISHTIHQNTVTIRRNQWFKYAYFYQLQGVQVSNNNNTQSFPIV